MANTYTQIHLHIVFAVQSRAALINESWRIDLYKYITGIVQNRGHKLLIINGMPDHLHLLIGMRPSESLSDLMKNIKGDSSKWINEKRFCVGKFNWQEGYGAFSYAMSQLPIVIRYIQNQELHHQQKNFHQEYKSLLEEFGVEYDDRYLFHSIES